MSSNPVRNEPFLDFSFGDANASSYGLYRVSNGSRYNDVLIPTLTDKTAEVPGGDGMYYFNTYYKQRQFTINFAYDSLTETDLRNVRNWLNGKEIKELSFPETSDRHYYAKVTGAPTFKYIAFDEPIEEKYSSNTGSITASSSSTHVIYKGEGSVQFTCYDPYAYGDIVTQEYDTTSPHEPTKTVGGEVQTPFYISSPLNDVIGNNTTIYIKYKNNDNEDIEITHITLKEPNGVKDLKWDSSTGMVKGKVNIGDNYSNTKPLSFIGNSMCNLPVGIKPKVVINNQINTYYILTFYNKYY